MMMKAGERRSHLPKKSGGLDDTLVLRPGTINLALNNARNLEIASLPPSSIYCY
jgi:hypothetical protein